MFRIYIYLTFCCFINLYHLETHNADCSLESEQKKRFKCTIQNVRDVNAFSCDATPHTCTVTRENHVTALPDVSDGTLTYFIDVTLTQYTQGPVSVTVSESETSETTKALANVVSLQCQLEPTEMPRIECDNVDINNNNFQSTTKCHIYVTTNTVELNPENKNKCSASLVHDAISDPGFLYKRTYSVTLVDEEKTCNRACEVLVKIQDSGGEEKSIPLSHTSTCSGHSIVCTSHDDTQRTITCKIKIPYDFLQVDFKSTKTYIDLDKDSKTHKSTSKEEVTKVLTYVIKDYQSTEKDFQIHYEVMQTSSKTTLTGTSSEAFTYVLKDTEMPQLECSADNDKIGLEYYGKGYKCTALSHKESIQIEADATKYEIVSGSSTGVDNNNLFTHATFEITVKAKVIVCNEQETIELFISDSTRKVTTNINQIINCQDPTISQESFNDDQRKITLKVFARYTFSVVSITSSINEIVLTIEQQAKNVKKNTVNDMYEILIPVEYDSSDISVQTRKFKIAINIKHSDAFLRTINSKEYTWNRNPDESSKLTCQLKATEVPLDIKRFVVSCDATTVNEDFSLNIQPDQFKIVETRVKKQKYKGMYKWKNYEVVLEDESLTCGQNQGITLSYTDREGSLTETINRNPICQGELVVCSRHDPIARTIKCKFIIPYPYKEIAISTGITNVKILPNKIESSDMKIENELTYTVTDPVDRTKEFVLSFQIYQQNQKLINTKTMTFSFQKKRDESTQISCSNKEEEPRQSTGTLKYKCNMISETSSLEINIHPSTYLINPSTITASKVGSLYKVTNNELSITPRTIKCGHHERIQISFTESTSTYETHVNHTTICREPIIKCEKHNIVDRIITCDFEIQYEFTEIKLSVNEGAVKLDSSTISSSVFKYKLLRNHQMKYMINDRSVSTSQFHIIFQVIQSSGNVAHQKAIGLRYFVKSDEIPRIVCRSTKIKQKTKFQSQLYECDVVSRSAKVKLSTSDVGFTLSPTEVQGDLKNGIYIHKDFPLTVTTNNIKCDDKKDVKIVANDGENNLEFTVKHSNICSDPIINCNSHDYDKREITCDVIVEFPFTSINLQSSLSTIVEIKTGNTITYNQHNPQKSFSHVILYEVTNWKHQEHQFNIQFSVMQDADQVAILTKTFRYVLKLSETPHISCSQNRIKSLNEYWSIIYKCDLLSLSLPNQLVPDSPNYIISDVTLNQEQSHEIYQLLNQEITIKPNSYICNKSSPVKISIDAVGTQPEHTVIHQTTCPEPIIRCESHDLEKKEISCNVQINFEFKEFQIKSTSPSVQISIKDDDATKISASGDRKYNALINIKYSITDYRSTDHYFGIIFDVILNDDSILFQIKRNFKYVLTENEIPHIKCRQTQDPSLNFYQAKFNCEIASVNKEVKLEVIPKEYKIDQHSSNGNDHGALYKNDGIDIIVEPVEITCDRREMIEIRFNDFGDVIHGEKFVHVTECPDASINQVSHSQRDRKVTLKVEAEYQYTILNVISNTQSVALIPHIGQGSSVANKWKTLVTFEYRPEDWSVDSHKFRAIITVQQQNVGWESKILSEEYTFETSQEEKPKIFCSLGNTESNTDFSQKVFTCNAITRQSIMMLNLSDANYRIVSTKGSSVDYKHVYQWNNHEITIQDVAITCNTPKSVDIFFTEYTNMYKSPITMSITCPIPKITINSHDTEKRIIILHVDSELPTYTSEILYLEKLLTFTKTDSIIKRRGRKWNSIITMEYTLNDLLNDKFTIPFSLRIKQHLEMIGTVELQFDYTLHENEKRQITCGVNEGLSEKQFAVTEYICYVVGTSSLAITLEPNSYKLSYDQTLPSRFVNIQRWENVSVRVQDTSIVCNKTVNITLTNKDGEDCFSTIVQHTTICDKIDGECVINQNDVTYIFCNFTSDTHFQLRNYSCSDAFNCSRSKDSDKISTKWNEFVFQLTPLSTDAYLEFDFHITLEHSIHSPVSFTFRLEYNIETAINLEVQKPPAAKIVTSFCNSLIFVAIFAVLLAYSLLRKIKNKIYVFEYPEKPSFRNL